MSEPCATGSCPVSKKESEAVVNLSEGSGGKEMQSFIAEIRERLTCKSVWSHADEDSASLVLPKDSGRLVFTTDSYVVTPIFFPGGDIGKIAMCGTINDLAVMGARPLGVSLSLIIEEGLPKRELFRIIDSINAISQETGVPIVTGDTKVMEPGAIDRIVITTSGVGVTDQVIDEPIRAGDVIIVSGGIGEHGAALLAKRFELQSDIATDSKALTAELDAVGGLLKQAKDITRGGLAAVLNELAEKHGCGIDIEDRSVPVTKGVRALTNILGLDVYMLACEGRFVCVAHPERSERIVKELRRFNTSAAIIGSVSEGSGVHLRTRFGKRFLQPPSGTLVPRIC